MGIHVLFIGNVLSHLVALMSGIASFAIAVWQAVKKHKISERIFWVIGALCLLMAFDQSWQDEHRNTQVVIVEKASEVGAKNSCFNDLRVQDAYVKGVESLNSSQRQTIDNQRNVNEKQQSAVNSCVISLGKMNPVINTKIVVLNVPIGEVTKHYREAYYSEMIITTNRLIRPVGNLKCDKSFAPVDPPQVPTLWQGPTMIGYAPAVSVSDHEYQIRITNTGGDWGPNSPIFFRVTSDFNNLGECTFTPQ
jgi:hypothetical protein